MDARRAKERQSSRFCQKLDVDVRNVSHDVHLVVDNWKRRDTLSVHDFEGFCDWPITIDGDDGLRSDIELS